MNRYLKTLLVFVCTTTLYSQTNNLTGSPYSLFGLGVQSNSNIGKNSALGNGGIALESKNQINNYNPASFSAIPEKAFLLDIGFLGELNKITNNNKDELRLATNFSNLAFAFSLNDRSGLGLSIVPFTDVGYALIGIESNVEGSQGEFISNIFGSGGLSDLRLNYGYQLYDNFSLGLRTSFLFGSIKETENILIGDAFLNIEEENYYNGFRFGIGFQYQINSKYSLGFTTDLPTSLRGSQDRFVTKSLDFITTETEDEEGVNIPDFKLPLDIGFGLALKPFNGITLNIDYRRSLWGQTDQRDDIGEFVDQSVISLGAQYRAREKGLKYWQNIEFRAGFNYDSGYLKVNNEVIDNYSITTGVGFPINRRGTSMLNISYTTGQRGAVEGILIQENFNLININLSLKDIWFKKIKFN
ncbi:OmpP1/FadL family transporter [Aquimarina sp. 2304DJ70-9]|uniref:OmpP1/FadL family transporter n=1 Tax=Aquimarina penaris TaxID=3231044 RepID=UPI003462E5EE